MPLADLTVPSRLLAGGSPSMPDPRVLRALTTPLVGQFDPAFTAIMDEVMEIARRVMLTQNARCFPVSGLAMAGLEAILNTLVEPETPVRVDGSAPFAADVSDMARRYGARVVEQGFLLRIVPHLDPETGELVDLKGLARETHDAGAMLIVDASLSLGACEVRTDAWGIDAVVSGVEAGIGAPPGLALVTYSAPVETLMRKRRGPPRTSYLDLLQLQAYWSPERLNHHTAPTSLVFALREALRIVLEEELEPRWTRHRRVAAALRAGLDAMRLGCAGHGPLFLLPFERERADRLRRRLLDEYGVHVGVTDSGAWRIGLLGADARLDACLRVLASIEQVLAGEGVAITPGAARAAALAAFESA